MDNSEIGREGKCGRAKLNGKGVEKGETERVKGGGKEWKEGRKERSRARKIMRS